MIQFDGSHILQMGGKEPLNHQLENNYIRWTPCHQTFLRWKTGRWFQFFFIFIPIWGTVPFWLVFLRWVETTNQKMSLNFLPCYWKSINFVVFVRRINRPVEGRFFRTPCSQHTLKIHPWTCFSNKKYSDTVDGRTPASVDMVNIPLFTGFYIPGGAGFLPSTVPEFCRSDRWNDEVM